MPFDSVAGRAVYRAAHWATFYTFTFGWSFRATGRENLPASGPVLLVANHQSFIDPVLVGLGATRDLTYLARSNLWDSRFLAPFITFWGAVPIDRGFGKEGLQTVLGELAKGRVVLMFPEGQRTRTGELQPLKPGVSLLVKRVTCPIVPVGVAGAYEAWPPQCQRPSLAPLLRSGRGGIGVAFRKPIEPKRYKGAEREEMLTDLENEIRAAYETAEQVRR